MTRRDLPPSVPVTALRVFEPLAAFPPELRRVLAAVAADPRAARLAEEAERRAAWRRLLGRPVDPRAGEGGPARERPVPARVLRVEGTVLLCPVSPEPPPDPGLPGLPGLPGFSGAARPGGPVEAAPTGLIQPSAATGRAPRTASGGAPAGAADAAAGPGVPPRRHTLVRAWELPVAWLAVVRREDLTGSGGPSRYVMPMSRARARAARSLKTLRTHLGELDVTADAEGLARWLEAFHPRSWVEVDARLVAALVGGEDGADDVRLGLESLTTGEAAAVAAAYQRLRRRSQRLEELSLSS